MSQISFQKNGLSSADMLGTAHHQVFSLAAQRATEYNANASSSTSESDKHMEIPIAIICTSFMYLQFVLHFLGAKCAKNSILQEIQHDFLELFRLMHRREMTAILDLNVFCAFDLAGHFLECFWRSDRTIILSS